VSAHEKALGDLHAAYRAQKSAETIVDILLERLWNERVPTREIAEALGESTAFVRARHHRFKKHQAYVARRAAATVAGGES
jgi:hypothetical protein